MSKKILVVEDEKNIAELERDYLEANGYTVEIEFDGKNGLDKAIGSDYDLVILDVMLPGIDGFEVCRQIRKHKECPVLMVSAKKDEIDKIRGLGLGADDYITKPFSPSELTASWVPKSIPRPLSSGKSNSSTSKPSVTVIGGWRYGKSFSIHGTTPAETSPT